MLGERRVTSPDGRSAGRRASDRLPQEGWRPALLIALAVAAADWGTKAAVAASMPLEGFREVVEGRVALWHVRNPYMMLGLWENLPLDARKALAAVAAVVAFVVLVGIVGRAHRLPRAEQRWAWLFVGLICGGMLGNLGERALHWGVTDFLSFRWGDYWLPPGNLADVALFLAIPLALPVIAFELRGRARRGTAPARVRLPRPAEAQGAD